MSAIEESNIVQLESTAEKTTEAPIPTAEHHPQDLDVNLCLGYEDFVQARKDGIPLMAIIAQISEAVMTNIMGGMIQSKWCSDTELQEELANANKPGLTDLAGNPLGAPQGSKLIL